MIGKVFVKYILVIFLVSSGLFLSHYGATKEIIKIPVSQRIEFIDSGWIGQGDSRYYSYIYKSSTKGEVLLISSRKKIQLPCYVERLNSNIYFQK